MEKKLIFAIVIPIVILVIAAIFILLYFFVWNSKTKSNPNIPTPAHNPATYKCNTQNWQCEPGKGSLTEDACASTCQQPTPMELGYGCDTKNYQCKPGLGNLSKQDCQAKCVKPTPTTFGYGCNPATGKCELGHGTYSDEQTCSKTPCVKESYQCDYSTWTCKDTGNITGNTEDDCYCDKETNMKNIMDYCDFKSDVRCLVCPQVKEACEANPKRDCQYQGWPSKWNQDPKVVSKNCTLLNYVQPDGIKSNKLYLTYVIKDKNGDPTCNDEDLNEGNSLIVQFPSTGTDPNKSQFCGYDDGSETFPALSNVTKLSTESSAYPYCEYQIGSGTVLDYKFILTSDIVKGTDETNITPCRSEDPNKLCDQCL